MPDAEPFALLLLAFAGVGLVAVLSTWVTEWLRVPSAALVLVGSAVVAAAVPSFRRPSQSLVDDVVTVALLVILFHGGMRIGWARFRSVAGTVLLVGVGGTLVTAVAAAVFLHTAFGLGWYPAVLVGTAVAPTDPAIVFAVLGRREITGPAGTILEGESGANDPVGVALMASLLSAGQLDGGAVGHVVGELLLQLVVGGAIGAVGGAALLWFARRVPLPGAGLAPLRSIAFALAINGIAVVAHGSGFLAVFVAGIIVGGQETPYEWEVEQFHGALASLAEIIAFVALGLTVQVRELSHTDVWVPGVLLAVVVAAVVRPAAVAACVARAGLSRGQRRFVAFAGLKGAVPILLGGALLAAPVSDPRRYYGIVVIVVGLSVLVHATLVPAAARRLGVPMRATGPPEEARPGRARPG